MTPQRGPHYSQKCPFHIIKDQPLSAKKSVAQCFVSNRKSRKGPLHLYVMDADGSNVRQVTDTFFAQSPKWSPDRQWILFTGGLIKSKEWQIYVVRPDGTDLWWVLEQKPDIDIHLGAWSPDEKRIVYTEALHNLVNNTTIFMATLHFAERLQVIGRTPVKIPRIIKVWLMLRFSAKKPSFFLKTRFLFVLCTFFLYEPFDFKAVVLIKPSTQVVIQSSPVR